MQSVKDFTMTEVEKVVKTLPGDKAPGPKDSPLYFPPRFLIHKPQKSFVHSRYVMLCTSLYLN